MKTPEQLAVEWLKEEYGDTSNWTYMGQEMSLDAFYAGYQAAQQWISVEERLPEDADEVLIAFGGGVSIACYGGDWRHPVYPMLPLLSVTHWMPLPSVEGLKDED